MVGDDELTQGRWAHDIDQDIEIGLHKVRYFLVGAHLPYFGRPTSSLSPNPP